MIEQTFILMKPDALQRCMIGNVILRFENAGLKLKAMKMLDVTEDLAKKHYAGVLERKGERVFKILVDYVTSGPCIAMVWEGVEAVANARKLIGPTQPKEAAPGTIRGDFAHMDYARADEVNIAVPNIVHSSGHKDEAEYEISLWFKPEELFDYKTINDKFCLLKNGE
jgi:nucleoside-diphosphate kinase